MDDDTGKKALKAAKKSLKKSDSQTMKLKELAKLVAQQLGDEKKEKEVKKWISKSDKFSLNGKEVSLSKKRSVGKEDDKPSDASRTKKAKTDEVKSTSTAKSSESEPNLSTVESWRKSNKIVVKHAKDDAEGKKETEIIGKDSVYFPFSTFDDCRPVINESLIRQCTEANGFKTPSPIQAQAWPILMHKKNGRTRDLVGIAETGSGKTLAFGLPALSLMMERGSSQQKRRPPRMLVLSPTRELAMQVETVLQEYGAVVGLGSLVLYGGVPKYTQVAELKKGNTDCIVATPGRLKDMINEGSCDLSKVQYLVLDEADRM
jgi:ATP-dependent RNA helicase DBP3